MLGFQVAPAELEALLHENSNVQDAVVVGVPGYVVPFPKSIKLTAV